MTSAPLSIVRTEEDFVLVLNEWLGTYFKQAGTIDTILGPVDVPACTLFFGAADLSSQPQDQPQIHTVITSWQKRYTWFAQGNLAVWENEIIHPHGVGGVAYGYAVENRIQEGVHGKLARELPGYNLRWITSGGALREQTQDVLSAWNDVRVFAGKTDIRWQRSGANYTEQVFDGTTWTNTRLIVGTHPLWDGTLKLIDGPLFFSIWVRVHNRSDCPKSKTQLRDVADALKNFFLLGRSRDELSQRGFQAVQLLTGPVEQPPQLAAYAELLTFSCRGRTFLPLQH